MNSCLVSTPIILVVLNTLFNIELVSIMSGLDITVIKGIIEATPSISKKAITNIITNSIIDNLRS